MLLIVYNYDGLSREEGECGQRLGAKGRSPADSCHPEEGQKEQKRAGEIWYGKIGATIFC
jgi:hypothetical protein